MPAFLVTAWKILAGLVTALPYLEKIYVAYQTYKKKKEQQAMDDFYARKNAYRSELLAKLEKATTNDEKMQLLKKLENLGHASSIADIPASV